MASGLGLKKIGRPALIGRLPPAPPMGGGVPPLVLPTGATAIYSSRRVSTWNGPFCRIVRTSDSAEMDVGFVGNVVDWTSAYAFAGTSSFAVKVVYDQSGSGRDATQGGAAYQPRLVAANRDGSDTPISFKSLNLASSTTAQFLSLPSSISVNSRSNTRLIVSAPRQTLGSSGYDNFGTSGNAASIAGMLYQQGHVGSYSFGPADLAVNTFASISKAQRFNKQFVGISAGPASVLMDVDNTIVTSSAHAAGTATGGFLGLGFFNSSYEFSFNGDLFFYALYPTAFDASALASAKAELTAKFAIPTTFSGLLAFDGDSIPAGTGSATGQTWPSLVQKALAAQGKRPKIYVQAVPSDSLGSNINGRQASTVNVLIDHSLGTNVLVITGGTNDIVAGASASSVYSSLTTYVANAKSAGWDKVIGVTLTPRSDNSAGAVTQGLAYNANLRANYGSIGLDGVIDVGNDGTVGYPGAPAQPGTYFTDIVHPNDLGASFYAALGAPVIAPLLP